MAGCEICRMPICDIFDGQLSQKLFRKDDVVHIGNYKWWQLLHCWWIVQGQELPKYAFSAQTFPQLPNTFSVIYKQLWKVCHCRRAAQCCTQFMDLGEHRRSQNSSYFGILEAMHILYLPKYFQCAREEYWDLLLLLHITIVIIINDYWDMVAESAPWMLSNDPSHQTSLDMWHMYK